MGNVADLFQIEKGSYPLDRVKRPEDGIDVIFVFRLLFQIQCIYFDLIDVFQALNDKIPQQ